LQRAVSNVHHERMIDLILRSGAIGRGLGALGGMAVIVLALGGGAEAQGRISEDSGMLMCVAPAIGCASGACAMGSTCLGGGCIDVSGDDRDFICCEPEADPGESGCPSSGSCEQIPGHDFGRCIDTEMRPLCLDEGHDPAGCFAGTSWALGDCDGDGTPNGEEVTAALATGVDCTCENADDTMTPECMRPDGGSASADAGTVRPVPDGGPSAQDAGQNDATLDAARDKPPLAADEWDYRGSGGCTCDAASAGADAEWLLCGLAVVIVARRRRGVRAAARSRGRRRS
jgi:hypothetical protein